MATTITPAYVDARIQAALGNQGFATTEELEAAIAAAVGFGVGGTIDTLDQVPPADSLNRTFFVNVSGTLTNFLDSDDNPLEVTNSGGVAMVIGNDTDGFVFVLYEIDLSAYREKDVDIDILDIIQAEEVIGKNLFNINASDITLGAYIAFGSGAEVPNAGYNATGFIPVTAGLQYTMSYKHQIAWYDEDKVYVSGSSSTDTNKTQTAPAGASYLRCSVSLANWSTFQVELGATQTAYEPFSSYIKLNGVRAESIDPTPEEGGNELMLYPKGTFFLKGEENTIYIRNVLKQNLPYQYPYISETSNVKNIGRGVRMTPTSGNGTLVITEVDNDYTLKSTKSVPYIVGDPVTDNGLIKINCIGDSYTYAGYYVSKTKDLIPNAEFIGVREPFGDLTIKVTANGGWTLDLYFTRFYSLTGSYTMFMHPPSPYTYWGGTDFWKKVAIGGSGYGWNGYEDLASSLGGFSTTTGYRTTPDTNDLMYNDDESQLKEWNGSAWVNSAVLFSSFTFDFGRYLSQYGIDTPDIVPVLLGLNDFRSLASKDAVDTKFTAFDAQMETLIASVKLANASAKIIILTPATYCGQVLNDENANVLKLESMMKHVRPKYFEEYSDREGEDVYICDSASSVDPDFGFVDSEVLPFADYTGSERLSSTNNTPHPSQDGYKQIGISLAACIQAIR